MAFKHISECLPAHLRNLAPKGNPLDVPEPSNNDLNDATEAVRNYIDALHESIFLARAELTLAAACMGSSKPDHRAMSQRRVTHALDALGGPIAPKPDEG